jgi:hypothetical protein
LVVALTVAAGPTAVAHGPTGIFQLQAPADAGPLRVTFRARLIYANDTEPVTSGATVTIEGTGPGGARLAPVRMTSTGADGYYQATVTFAVAGSWALTYRSVNPEASASQQHSVPGPAPTSSPTTMPTPTTPRTTVPTIPRPTVPTTPTTRRVTPPSSTVVATVSSPTTSDGPATTAAPDTTPEGTASPDTSGPAPSAAPTTSERVPSEQAAVVIEDAASGPGATMSWPAVGVGVAAGAAIAGAGITAIARRPRTAG